jgi:hypothetical protein
MSEPNWYNVIVRVDRGKLVACGVERRNDKFAPHPDGGTGSGRDGGEYRNHHERYAARGRQCAPSSRRRPTRTAQTQARAST